MNQTKQTSYFSFLTILKDFVNSSVLLILATVLALVLANSQYSDLYQAFRDFEISLTIAGVDIFQHNGHTMTMGLFVNDALMAIFFFVVGLEIKREFMVGALSTRKQALLPIIAAVGGVAIPVLLYRMMASDPLVLRGAAIPMATDIAFSLGVLSVLGRRIPIGLKIFLTALAVVDDLIGIIVIAIFYTGHISPQFLMIAAGLLAILVIGAKMGVSRKSFYVIIGIAIWFMFYNSGIHATIAGVLVALCVPAKPKILAADYIERMRDKLDSFPHITKDGSGQVILSNNQIHLLNRIEGATKNVISPLQKLESMLHAAVSYFIIPMFAFMNAGLSLEGITFDTFTAETTLAIMVGLVFGKFLGIFTFSFAAIKTGIVDMPKGVNLKGIAGVAILGGIGFTISIFIGTLSFASIEGMGAELLNQAKLGILTASVAAALIGYLYLNFTHKKVVDEDEE